MPNKRISKKFAFVTTKYDFTPPRISKKFAFVSTKNDFTPPNENQTICKLTKSLGNNTFQVLSQNGEEFIASLVKMFRNNVMTIPGSYVITEPIPDGYKVKAEIVRILQPNQMKKFNRDGIWPVSFSDCIYINNGYTEEFKEEVDKHVVRTRKPLCSASYYLGGTTSVTVADDHYQQSDDVDDEMPYIPPNPNLKGASRMVYLNEDGSFDHDGKGGGRRGNRRLVD